MLAGTDDHLTWLSPVILNLENMGLTHLESEIRVGNHAPLKKTAMVETSVEISYSFLKKMIEDIVKNRKVTITATSPSIRQIFYIIVSSPSPSIP